MSVAKPAENTKTFLLSSEIFDHPNLDIYAQMACVVLQYYSSEASLPTLQQISSQGRMNQKQATRALQTLVDLHVLSHKMFRQIVGEFTDDRLSWAAKGLFAYCKDHPHVRWNDLLELCSQSGESEQSVRKALKELNQAGYLDDFAELRQMVN